MTTTDFRTYPGDRNTRHTPAQIERKIAAAQSAAEAAVADLRAVCDDYAAHGYRLTEAQRTEWREAARMHDAMREALR